MDKQQKQPTISTQHLLQLIKNKKYPEYKNYVSLQSSQAEQAVVVNLEEIFVKKKYKLPSIYFNALVLYKMLMVGASMDFLCQQALFPKQIHLQLEHICSYKGTQKDLQKRCSHYFSETLGIPHTQQAARFGYNYILLALQLLKSLAKWYPSNYDQPKKSSIFKKMYDKLVGKNVVFPPASQFKFIKSADEQKFANNYNEFKSNFSKLQQLQQQATPQPKLQTPQKPNRASNQSMIQQKSMDSGTGPILPEILSNLAVSQKNSLAQNGASMLQIKGQLVSGSKNVLNVENSQRLSEQFKSDDLIQGKKRHEEKTPAQQTPKLQQEVIQSSVVSLNPNKPMNKGSQIAKQVVLIKKQIEVPKVQQTQPQHKTPLQQHINKRTQNIVEKHQIVQQLATSFLNSNRKGQRNHSPKHMFRTEKRNISPKQQNDRKLSTGMKSSSHKSLPKTQKRKISTKQQKEKAFKAWVDFQGPQNRKFKNTLSQLSSLRKEVASKQIDEYSQISYLLHNMRFDSKIVAFNVQHFKPLRLSLVSLRQEALNLADFPNSFNQFYTGVSIEARLIKEGSGLFILSLRNISEEALSIGFKDMSNQRFSNHIKVLSWGNRTDFKPYSTSSLLRNTHLDIKFTVHICDYALKFLPFDFVLNGEECFFVLPITLLDMTHPKPAPEALNLQQFRLTGTSITSNPFELRGSGLPKFLGKFYFKEFISIKVSEWQERIVGGCRLQIPIESYVREVKKQIIVLVKMINYSKRLVQLMIVYTKRDTQSERFSMAYLQLLQFLLAQQ